MLDHSMPVACWRNVMRLLVCAGTFVGAQSCSVPFFIARSSPASASTGPKLPLQRLEYFDDSSTAKNSHTPKSVKTAVRDGGGAPSPSAR